MKRVKNIPLYILAKEEIHHFIINEKLKSGDKLPPESELCARLGISRGSLREAMRALEEEALVVRKQGIGTFVALGRNLIQSTLDVNEGVTEMIRGKGMVPGSRDTRVEEITARGRVARNLGVQEGSPVMSVRRIRTADGVAVALTEDFLPRDFLPGEAFDEIDNLSLYNFIEKEMGIELSSSMVELEPLKAKKAMAEILGIKPGDLLMFLKQTDTDRDRRPILYSEEYFVSQRFEFVVLRKRKVHLDRMYGR